MVMIIIIVWIFDSLCHEY